MPEGCYRLKVYSGKLNLIFVSRVSKYHKYQQHKVYFKVKVLTKVLTSLILNLHIFHYVQMTLQLCKSMITI